ncbi:hypothetical protein [Blastopirellula marina]|uniref:Uncharacterized protein n=1 Tax=Blastopirellula marina TaxID=124 RepID=A0A2S8FPD7_9BACT|nr:hypothetical protein [Blastopirellula marina]PQO34018.1 hypothetical protein C5Y98_17555 [Blastopirellula marina]PTL43804.1 hypothetical protein C5Y97_17565 [Blastopirellula marina]
MARFLKALQGLQSLDPVTPEKSPEVQVEFEDASLGNAGGDFPAASRSRNEAPAVPSRTIVMQPEVEQAMPTSVSEKDELVKKLTQQLAIALKQRDVVAEEMLRVREKLESNDQRHEEEIVRLRDALEVHQRSAQTIENELKSIEAELRQQLSRQQQEFVQRLGEVERQVREHTQRPLPAIPEAASEAELREFQTELRQHMVREKEEFVQRLGEIEKRMSEHVETTAAEKKKTDRPRNDEAKLKSLQAELQKQMVRQQEEFVQRIAEVEKQVRKQAERPVAETQATTKPATSSGGKGELFHPYVRGHESEKQIPNTKAIGQALTSFSKPDVAKEFDQLATAVFGPIDFQCMSQPEIVFFGTCLPGEAAGNVVLGLAAWLSQHSCDVLVIDGALRKKELTAQMGLGSSPGLFEFVRRETYRQDGTYRDTETGISFIPAGKSSFVLTDSESDFTSLRDQLREITKANPIVLIAGEGPDLSASWLLAQVATKIYLQAGLGQVSGDDVRAAVDCYLQLGIEPTGLVATNPLK